MTLGVIEHSKFDSKEAAKAGFDFVEKSEQIVALSNTTVESLVTAIQNAVNNSYKYIVISTMGDCNISQIYQIIQDSQEEIKKHNIVVLIENGIAGSDQKGYTYNDFSDITKIRKVVEFGESLCGKGKFGICINVGYANLIAQNIRLIIEGSDNYIQLVHINDNDGFSNDKQMPYTFTKGRGDQTTDWYRVIGSLIRINYDGSVVFDTEGLFNRTPVMIVPAMLKMLKDIGTYWNSIIHFEDILNCNKKIILFGAGRMASNYMYIWGDKFCPAFIVDNDSKRWGSKLNGIEIKSPEEILTVPEEERLVLLCNMRYEEIGCQLQRMNVSYVRYDDNYYDFVM